VNVLYKPALIPLGGSLVTLIAFYNKANGNLLCGSHVIHNLKSLCIGYSLSAVNNPIISSIRLNPK
jgi:hypothetical protein